MFLPRIASSRAGLTLLELVVVLGILVILASLVVPNVGGLIFQSRHAGNAAMVGDVNRAVNAYVARFCKHPDRWDSLLDNSTSTLFNKLDSDLSIANVMLPGLVVNPLSTAQAASLQAAGITTLLDADNARSVTGAANFVYPSDNASANRAVVSGTQMAFLTKPATAVPPYGTTFMDVAFGLNPQKTEKWANEFIVVGLGTQNAMRGSTMADIPVVQSATPLNFYARVLCVYMVPGSTATTSFPARYVGCFLPDGTSLPTSLMDYNKAGALDQ
ncbi:MAG: prepilin-type N-terminal cleavage/methylation domain-containing protein [Planctomycetaceae bacterium]|nr:prepilin-type N-terminal cleavage/methylation domain-containing protein [Planctomycetaceae bacterium]